MKAIILWLWVVEAWSAGADCPHHCECSSLPPHGATCSGRDVSSLDVGLPAHLQFLTFTNTSLTELEDYIFLDLNLTKVKVLRLEHGHITWTGLHAFDSLNLLSRLSLRSNRIQQVYPDGFYSNIHLVELDLSGNPLEALKTSFLRITSLQILLLNSSEVSYTSPSAFDRLPNLRMLDLSDNRLVKLEPSTVTHLKKLQFLYVSGNPLHCGPEMNNLTEEVTARCVQVVGINCSEPVVIALPHANSAVRNETLHKWHKKVRRKLFCNTTNLLTDMKMNSSSYYYEIINTNNSHHELDTNSNHVGDISTTSLQDFTGKTSYKGIFVVLVICLTALLICIFLYKRFLRLRANKTSRSTPETTESDIPNSFQVLKLMSDD